MIKSVVLWRLREMENFRVRQWYLLTYLLAVRPAVFQ